MKRSLGGFLVIVMICSIFGTLNVIAENQLSSGDYTYRVLEDNTAEILGYSGIAAEVEIPSEIDGLSVTGIGDLAFGECANLISVSCPKIC